MNNTIIRYTVQTKNGISIKRKSVQIAKDTKHNNCQGPKLQSENDAVYRSCNIIPSHLWSVVQ